MKKTAWVQALLLAWLGASVPPPAAAAWGAGKAKSSPSHRRPSKKSKAKPIDVRALPGLAPELSPGTTPQAEPPAPGPAAKADPPHPAPERRPAAKPAARPFIAYSGPRYSFEAPADWLGPEFPPSEMRYLEPGGKAFISIAFIERGAPMYKDPTRFRRYMRQLGSIEDTHSLDTVKVSGRFASRARFTTHFYPRTKLLGQAVSVFYTEMIMVPDRDGLYVVRYQAAKPEFQKSRPAFISFLATLVLPKTSAPPEDYYVRQDHIVKELLEETPEAEEKSAPSKQDK